MSAPIKRTLREAHAVHEALVDNIATLCEVVADDDMPDAYSDHSLESRFTKEVGRRFAEQLVARMLYDDDMLIEWMGPEQGHDRLGGRDLSDGGDGNGPCLECEDPEEDGALLVAPPTRAEIDDWHKRQAEEYAATFDVGDPVVRIADVKRAKTRGIVQGRKMDAPTVLQVRWADQSTNITGAIEWVDAADLGHAADRGRAEAKR